MATLEELTQEIQPLRSTTLADFLEENRQKRALREENRLQQKFVRDVGAPDEFRVVGAPYVVNRKKEKDKYALKKLAWERYNLL